MGHGMTNGDVGGQSAHLGHVEAALEAAEKD